MKARIALVFALALAGSVRTATAQGRPQQQIVLSPSVLKSMTAQKPKSKAPLTARIGTIRRAPSALPVAPSPPGAPTAVREVRRKPGAVAR
ncbi:MAG: hypothetical protein ABIQ55_06665 [Gemmatimonadaceae bacterium]